MNKLLNSMEQQNMYFSNDGHDVRKTAWRQSTFGFPPQWKILINTIRYWLEILIFLGHAPMCGDNRYLWHQEWRLMIDWLTYSKLRQAVNLYSHYHFLAMRIYSPHANETWAGQDTTYRPRHCHMDSSKDTLQTRANASFVVCCTTPFFIRCLSGTPIKADSRD